MNQMYPIRLGLNLKEIDTTLFIRNMDGLGCFAFKVLSPKPDIETMENLSAKDFILVDDEGNQVELPIKIDNNTKFNLGTSVREKLVTKLSTRDWCLNIDENFYVSNSYTLITDYEEDKTIVAYSFKKNMLSFNIPNTNVSAKINFLEELKTLNCLRSKVFDSQPVSLKIRVFKDTGEKYYIPVFIDDIVDGRVLRNIRQVLDKTLMNLKGVIDYRLYYM